MIARNRVVVPRQRGGDRFQRQNYIGGGGLRAGLDRSRWAGQRAWEASEGVVGPFAAAAVPGALVLLIPCQAGVRHLSAFFLSLHTLPTLGCARYSKSPTLQART